MTFTAKDLAKIWAYMTDAEIDALQRVVRLLPPRPFVINVGAGSGVSGLAIFQARDDVLLCTVDINWQSPFGSLVGEKNAFKKADIPIDHPHHYQIQGDSREVAANWKGRQADMIFIDDGHTYEDITGDIAGWEKHVKPNGILSFHDYGSENWPAVKQAVDEWANSRECVEHTDNFIAFLIESSK